jgi:Elongation factor P (EF-P) KOW-like domain
MTVELDNEPYKVLSFSIMKQARGAAKTTIKFKNLIRGTTIENTYRSGEKFETALIEKKAAQFTYKDEVSVLFLFFIIVGIILLRYSLNFHASHSIQFNLFVSTCIHSIILYIIE